MLGELGVCGFVTAVGFEKSGKGAIGTCSGCDVTGTGGVSPGLVCKDGLSLGKNSNPALEDIGKTPTQIATAPITKRLLNELFIDFMIRFNKTF